MKLAALVGDDAVLPAGAGGIEVTGLTLDSRTVTPGMVFAALAGARADGSAFVKQAVAAGAAAVLAGPDARLPADVGVPVLQATDPRRAVARMAARYYGRQPERIVAVTGTSGKTSVAEFTRQILAHNGRSAASLGTIGVVTPGGADYGLLTTPDPVTLHRTLAELAAEGITDLAMEASSHGLDQRRLDGVRLSAGAFTNLGRDHMDYHPTVEHYFAAKLRLFTELLPAGATAVGTVGDDEGYGDRVMSAARRRGLAVLTVGRTVADIQLVATTRDGFAQRVEAVHAGRTFTFRLPLVGVYQVWNAVTAVGLAIATGGRPDACFAALENLNGVAGRLDVVGEHKGGLVVVDYAHKPDALVAALGALKPFATGRLICVFGCGGDRDQGKRPIMGEISARDADMTIVTDDNPRSEDAAQIRRQVLAGTKSRSSAIVTEIGDRGEAIATAIAMMQPGDLVLIAGKGHEPGQIVGNVTLPFSDHAAARAAMARS